MEPTLHGTDDQLEAYALGRLSDDETPRLEEHLLTCSGCRTRLDEVADFAQGLREALKGDPSLIAVREWSGFAERLRRFGSSMKPAYSLSFAAIAMALIAAAVFFAGERPRFVPAAFLELTATRGEMPLSSPARETNLTLTDAPPAGGPFHVEVVDSSGKPRWSGETSGGAVKVPRPLAPGDYFVRLYGPDNRVLHEYGFRVRG